MERLKEANLAVGQGQPIRVWKVLEHWASLAKQHPDDELIREIRVEVGNAQDDEGVSRPAVQVLGSTGEDLTPAGKARALEEIRQRDLYS